MTQSQRDEFLKKWEPLLNNEGLYMGVDLASGGTSSGEFPSLLPISMKIASKTIGLDLVSVQPILSGNSMEELERMKGEVTQENRDRAIDSVIEDKDFNPMKIEDHPDYIKGPEPKLMYMDFKYNSGTFSLGEDNENDI